MNTLSLSYLYADIHDFLNESQVYTVGLRQRGGLPQELIIRYHTTHGKEHLQQL